VSAGRDAAHESGYSIDRKKTSQLRRRWLSDNAWTDRPAEERAHRARHGERRGRAVGQSCAACWRWSRM